jgi:hypothetical protein
MEESKDLICGVDRQLIETLLILIRDNYNKADRATFFLEQRTGIINVQGIANLRDVLSHLVTLLKPDTPAEKKAEQLANAEEHLRRAIIEPYETANNDLLIRFDELYFNYKRNLLPVKDRHLVLQSAPNIISIEASLREFGELYTKGRSGKGKNIWTREWESGLTSFIDAFELLSALYIQLEGHWNNYEQIMRDRRSTWWAILSIAATIITFILGFIIAWLIK